MSCSLTIITVDDQKGEVKDALYEAAKSRSVGYGWNDGISMGPVITPESKARITDLIELGINEGANLLLDGRNVNISGYEKGNFLSPSIFRKCSFGQKIN